MNEEKWTSNSPKIKDQDLTIYITDEYKGLFMIILLEELEWF